MKKIIGILKNFTMNCRGLKDDHYMKKESAYIFFISAFTVVFLVCSISPAFGLKTVSKDPYLGAIVIDAATGKVLVEDHADVKGYPASMIKLMNLLIILEAIEAGHISLEDEVTVSARVSKIGGSQVYLKEKEVFSVDELLYAMMVQSANDAALALAVHYTGSMEVFVDLMNKRARKIGMKNTVFHSVHGLPPSRKQLPDVSTPRDMAKLCQELLKHPEALKYTSTKVREFRPDVKEPFIMRTHNHLLKDFDGCDGLKTGYFRAGGFSIAATAKKSGVRAIAVVFGSVRSKTRDEKARILLSKGLMEILTNPSPPVAKAAEKVKVPEKKELTPETEYVRIPKRTFKIVVTLNVVVIMALFAVVFFQRVKRNRY
jgi:serine-type D-Ala-D-Ala carboxypeptidase (penicillin-binding protein 5/6)